MTSKYNFRLDPKQTTPQTLHSAVEPRTQAKRAAINTHYRDLAIAAKKGCNPEDGANIDLIAMSMAKMTLMQGNVEGGGRPVRQTGGQLIDFMVPMLLLFSGDVNAFFSRAADSADDIINWFAGWWSTLSECVRGFWRTIFPTGQEHAAAAALLGLGGNQAEREANTWNYIMEMIGSATTSAMEGAAAAGRGVGAMGASAMEGAVALSTAVQTKIQPSINWAKDNQVQFGAGVAAMGSNIYLFGDTVASGAMWLLTFLQGVPLTHWMVATSIIATYLAIKGSGNIAEDRDALVDIIKAAPAEVIVATHTTPAKIKAVQTNIKTYYTEARTRGLLAARGITETAEEDLERAERDMSVIKQRAANKKNTKGNKDKAQTKIASVARGRLARQKAADDTRKERRATIFADKRGPAAGASAAAGSGQPPLTSFGFGPKEGGKRNTKKRSNKKKKTKKHKKKQHRKTKRG